MAETFSIKEELDNVLIDVANVLGIKNYELVPNVDINNDDSFKTITYTGVVINKLNGKMIHVAIKKNPSFVFVDNSGIFKNEFHLYTKILSAYSKLQKEFQILYQINITPQFYCSSLEKNKEYIAIENIKAAGYTMADKKEYLNEEHLKLIFKTYGQFHGLSFVLKKYQPKQYNSLVKEFTEKKSGLLIHLQQQVTDSMSTAIKTLNPEIEPIAYEKLQKIVNNLKENYLKVCSYKGNFSCITHGDCWSNNIMFKYKESGKLESLKLLNFQLVCENSPVHDLSCIFYSSVAKEDLTKLDDYLKIYHRSFAQLARDFRCNPDDLLSLDVLKQDWKNYALFGVYLSSYIWRIKLFPKDRLLGDDKENIAHLYASKEYRDRVHAIVLHAVEYGVI